MEQNQILFSLNFKNCNIEDIQLKVEYPFQGVNSYIPNLKETNSNIKYDKLILYSVPLVSSAQSVFQFALQCKDKSFKSFQFSIYPKRFNFLYSPKIERFEDLNEIEESVQFIIFKEQLMKQDKWKTRKNDLFDDSIEVIKTKKGKVHYEFISKLFIETIVEPKRIELLRNFDIEKIIYSEFNTKQHYNLLKRVINAENNKDKENKLKIIDKKLVPIKDIVILIQKLDSFIIYFFQKYYQTEVFELVNNYERPTLLLIILYHYKIFEGFNENDFNLIFHNNKQRLESIFETFVQKTKEPNVNIVRNILSLSKNIVVCLSIIFNEGELLQNLFTQHYKDNISIDISSLVHFSEKDNLQEIFDLAQKIEKKNFTFVHFDENIWMNYLEIFKNKNIDSISLIKKDVTTLSEETKDYIELIFHNTLIHLITNNKIK